MEESCLIVATPAEASPELLYAARERERLIAWCLRELDRRKAKLMFLRYEQGMTFSQIAGELEVVESAVAQMHDRVLRGLREKLKLQGVLHLRDIL